MPENFDIDEVQLTDTAKSKCFRMISQNRLKHEVKSKDWHRQTDNVEDGYYSVKSGYEDENGNWNPVVIVVTKKERDSGRTVAVVVTQKHAYHSN